MQRVRTLAKRFPVLCILGARQVGKTTLARQAFPRATYLDLERPSDLDRIRPDPEFALESAATPLILDEAQSWPDVFPVLRGLVDKSPRRTGRFVIVGSAQPTLVRGVSESLAGRVGILDLDPLMWSETRRGSPIIPMPRLWLRGGYPGALRLRSDGAWRDWMEGYTRTFVERDIGALGLDVSVPMMRRLWAMLAHVHGGLWNASEIASSLGTSYHTVNRYVDILEQCFLVRRLPPYFRNVGKRLTRSPKLYIRDTGLLHFFLGISTPNQLDVFPRRGASWEAFVIEQIIRAERITNPSSQFFFWRTATGAEIDLVIDRGGNLSPIEVKLVKHVDDRDLRNMRSCLKDLGVEKGVVLCETARPYAPVPGVEVVPVGEFLRGVHRL